MHQEYIFRCRSCRAISWELAGVPDHRKRIHRSTQNLVEWRKEGKQRKIVNRTNLHLGDWGAEPGLRSPHQSNWLGQKGSIWGCWRGKVICNSLNGVRMTQTIRAMALHTPDGDASPPECMVTGRWRIETGEQFQDKHCCWPQGDGPRRWEGGEHGRECLWKKARKPWRQGATAESQRRDGAHHCSLSLSTCKHRQLTNR